MSHGSFFLALKNPLLGTLPSPRSAYRMVLCHTDGLPYHLSSPLEPHLHEGNNFTCVVHNDGISSTWTGQLKDVSPEDMTPDASGAPWMRGGKGHQGAEALTRTKTLQGHRQGRYRKFTQHWRSTSSKMKPGRRLRARPSHTW